MFDAGFYQRYYVDPRTRVASRADAVRLGRFCGNGAAFWLRLQGAHDLWGAEQKLQAELEKIPEHPAA